MGDNDQALRYVGGGSLTFADGAGRRRHVLHGASFVVDQETAGILLQDLNVHPTDEPLDVPRGTGPAALVSIDGGRPPEAEQIPPQIDVARATKKELLEYAALLGLEISARAKVDSVRRRIEKERKRRQALRAPLVAPAAVAVGVVPAPTKRELLERAETLGLDLPKRATNDAIAAAIAAEEASRTAANQGGSSSPANDPEAPSSGEAGQPPDSSPSAGGAITLGDLPEGGKVKS
jgi:post-segregation antitoxin (ccd killing protein)